MRRPFRGGHALRTPDKARQKPCKFCVDKTTDIDYKDAMALRRFLSEQGKILGRHITGNCAEHQRQVTLAVKRSRELAL